MSLKQLTEDYVSISQETYESLIRQSEQLEIIKNFIKLDDATIFDLKRLIKAIEANVISICSVDLAAHIEDANNVG